MNEKLIFQFSQSGKPLPIEQIFSVEQDRGGLILNGEASAWPRGLRFDFEGVGPFKDRLNKLRDDEANGEHRFSLDVQDGTLNITTLSPNRIPTGTYDFRLRIADMVMDNGEGRIKVTEGSPTSISINVSPESRTVKPTNSINADKPIADVVNSESQLDGKPVIDWLHDESPRAKRKACLLNILAVLRTIPSEESPLINHVREIFFADVDRIYAKVDIDLFTRLQELDQDPDQPFSHDSGPIHPTHLLMKRRIPAEDQDATEKYVFQSFRQDSQPSLQIVVAIPPDDRPRGVYADIDIDLGNPKRDLAGFFIHLGELVAEGQTDHLKLSKQLAKIPSLNGHLHYEIS